MSCLKKISEKQFTELSLTPRNNKWKWILTCGVEPANTLSSRNISLDLSVKPPI